MSALQMPNTFSLWYQEQTGHVLPSDVLTHMKHKLMHAVWRLMLDKEFMKAYDKGTLVNFADGKTWLVLPRIFTYLADYLEK
jgi:hypothetical protein